MTGTRERRKSQLSGLSPVTPREIVRAQSEWPELFEGLTSAQMRVVDSGLSLRLRDGQELHHDVVQALTDHARSCPLAHA